MKAPAVSHRKWERTRALAQIQMGTLDIRADELAFEDRMMMLIEPDFRGQLREIEEEDKDIYHNEWGPDGVDMTISLGDRVHRPEVSDDAIGALDEWVKKEHPHIPAEKVDFDDKLGLVLDSAQEYFRKLNCRLRPANPQ